MGHRHAVHCLTFGLIAIWTACPAGAQVYQIDEAGGVQVRQGGGAIVWQAAGDPAPLTRQPTKSLFQPGSLLDQAAKQAGLSPHLLEALVWQESRWQSNAVSPKGAIGLTQLMPGTARDLGVDPHDPIANLFAGARYLRRLLDHFNGDLVKALAAYNAGIRRVETAGGVPRIRETQNYVASILARLDRSLNRD